MMLFPFRTNAAAQALCIELLEAGACIFPDKVDGCIVTFIYQLIRDRDKFWQTSQ
jgi:hypothetical protein